MEKYTYHHHRYANQNEMSVILSYDALYIVYTVKNGVQ